MSKKKISPLSKGYSDAGASVVKRSLKGFLAVSGAPSEDIDLNNKTLRQRGRMLYMASPIAAAAINTNRTKIVGSGLRLKSAINNNILGLSETEVKKWQQKTEAEWRMWAEKKANCDALGKSNFYELQQLALKSWLMSGDVFSVLKRRDATPLNPYTLRLHLVEADRISTPTNFSKGSYVNITEGINPENKNKIYDGVEIDKDGRVVAYYICDVYPNQLTSSSAKWQRVEIFGKRTGLPNILHIMDAERPDQYRGVTYIAPVIEMLLQLRRYTEAELTAAIIQSFLTAWITTESDTTDFPLNEVGSGGDGEEVDNVSDSPDEYEMGPGTINHMRPGENIIFGNPNMPVAGFESFVKMLCKITGAALELPYDVLIKEFNSSYSAAKGALEESWQMFKMRRSWFVTDFCQPVYESWLAEAVAIGRIQAPGFFDNPLVREAWCGARWDGPAQTHLDPVKEATANEILVSHGWKTNGQITRESYGGSWEDNVEIIKRETKQVSDTIKTQAKQPNKKGEDDNAEE